MTYADYEFYSQTWGGALPEAAFDRVITRAQYALDAMTRGRIKQLWEEATDEQKNAVAMAQCALIDQHLTVDNADKQVVSETVGSYSVSYASARSAQTRMRNIVRPYLYGITVDGQSLLYRGLEEGRCCSCT